MHDETQDGEVPQQSSVPHLASLFSDIAASDADDFQARVSLILEVGITDRFVAERLAAKCSMAELRQRIEVANTKQHPPTYLKASIERGYKLPNAPAARQGPDFCSVRCRGCGDERTYRMKPGSPRPANCKHCGATVGFEAVMFRDGKEEQTTGFRRIRDDEIDEFALIREWEALPKQSVRLQDGRVFLSRPKPEGFPLEKVRALWDILGRDPFPTFEGETVARSGDMARVADLLPASAYKPAPTPNPAEAARERVKQALKDFEKRQAARTKPHFRPVVEEVNDEPRGRDFWAGLFEAER